jgi:N-acetylneuraminate synthase
VPNTIRIGDFEIGTGHPTWIIAEVGINHNGDTGIAKQLINVAASAGCDAVKFQKRTPELCVPAEERARIRETPWGDMTYLEYRKRLELNADAYAEINRHCQARGITWFASAWDIPSVDFLMSYEPPCIKVPSAQLTNTKLLDHIARLSVPVLLSTGMSTMDEIRAAVARLRHVPLMLMHTTSAYPCSVDEVNLLMVRTLASEFNVPLGYSGHEVGLQISLAAVVLGACAIERHITLDRAMWGSDQAASVEPSGLSRLVRDVRVVEKAMGDGVKRVYDSERTALRRLRGKSSD